MLFFDFPLLLVGEMGESPQHGDQHSRVDSAGPVWIMLTHPILPAARPYACGTLHAVGLNTTEEGDSLTSLAVRPIVAASAGASVAALSILTRRSVLTRVTLTLVVF